MRLTIGPILFHWPAEKKIDFYARIADEAPVDTVYLGEVICSKRTPFFEPHLPDVIARLERGGKTVVLSSLSEVMLKRERDMMEAIAATQGHEIEINDASALLFASGRPHRLGPLMNVYNDETLAYLAKRGATHVCAPPELPGASLAILAARGRALGVGVEAQAFGRASLAISARCYHARAHGRVKDNCQFVCEEDPDGMPLKGMDGKTFLTVNGVQTLSHAYLDLSGEIEALVTMGVSDLRLSPHGVDMVAAAQAWRDALDGRISSVELKRRIAAIVATAPVANGFFHGRAGHLNLAPAHGS